MTLTALTLTHPFKFNAKYFYSHKSSESSLSDYSPIFERSKTEAYGYFFLTFSSFSFEEATFLNSKLNIGMKTEKSKRGRLYFGQPGQIIVS